MFVFHPEYPLCRHKDERNWWHRALGTYFGCRLYRPGALVTLHALHTWPALYAPLQKASVVGYHGGKQPGIGNGLFWEWQSHHGAQCQPGYAPVELGNAQLVQLVHSSQGLRLYFSKIVIYMYCKRHAHNTIDILKCSLPYAVGLFFL